MIMTITPNRSDQQLSPVSGIELGQRFAGDGRTGTGPQFHHLGVETMQVSH